MLATGSNRNDVVKQNQSHERYAKDQSCSTHDVIKSSLTFVSGTNASASTHGIALTGDEDEECKNNCDNNRKNEEDSAKYGHGDLIGYLIEQNLQFKDVVDEAPRS